MKFISILIFSFTLSAYASGRTTDQLSDASLTASDQVETLYGEKSVLAYRAQYQEHGFLIDVLTQFNGQSFALSYDCDQHGDHADCHNVSEQNFATELKEGLELELLHASQKSAFALLSDRLKEKLFAFRVWGLVHNDDHDHGAEQEVWVRFDLNLNGNTRHFFVMCHDAQSHESAQESDDDHDDHHDRDCHVERNADFVPSFPEL